MKYLIYIFTLLSVTLSAQEFNQYNAQGKRHGKWKKNFKNTDKLRYEGEFKNGKEVGVFKFYKLIGGKSVLTATKQFNPQNNITEVTFLASNGKVISKGQMNAKKYIGDWVYYHNNSDKIMMTEHYNSQGNLEGEKINYYKSGVPAEKEYYKNGKREGKLISYAENGKVKSEFIYENDELHGPFKSYDKNGQVEIDGQYFRDKKKGVWKYYKNGKLQKEKDFTVYSKNPFKKQ